MVPRHQRQPGAGGAGRRRCTPSTPRRSVHCRLPFRLCGQQGTPRRNKAFLDLQGISCPTSAKRIQRTGRRTGYEGVSAENADVFRADWGVSRTKVLSHPDALHRCAHGVSGSVPDAVPQALPHGLLSGLLRQHGGLARGTDGGGHEPDPSSEKTRSKICSRLPEHESISSSPLRGYPGTSTPPLGTGGAGSPLYSGGRRRPWAAPHLLCRHGGPAAAEKPDLSQYTPAIILLTDGVSDGVFPTSGTATRPSGARCAGVLHHVRLRRSHQLGAGGTDPPGSFDGRRT